MLRGEVSSEDSAVAVSSEDSLQLSEASSAGSDAKRILDIKTFLGSHWFAWENVSWSHARMQLYQLLSPGADLSAVRKTDMVWKLFPGTPVTVRAALHLMVCKVSAKNHNLHASLHFHDFEIL